MTTTSDTNTAGTPTDDFESALRSLVLESFAEGTAIQGTWVIESASSVVPDWRVTIEKLTSVEPPHDESAFLDE